VSRAHERYRQTDRQTTDGRAIAYSERELTFTFAKNRCTWLPLLCLTPPTEGFPFEDLCKIFRACQWMANVPNAVKYCRKLQPPEYDARALLTDRQTTDGRATAYSERERDIR